MKYCLIWLVLLTGLVHAQHSPLFHATKQHLIRLDMDLRTAASDIDTVERLSEFQELLRHYLVTADPKEFVTELRELTPLVEAIGHRSNDFNHRFRPARFSKSYHVKDRDGNAFPLFTNSYRSNEELTEQEKSQLYLHEKQSYEEYGIHPKYELSADTLDKIEPNAIYNFVVTSDHAVFFAVEYDDPTICRATDKGISIKRIRSPNHTILAGHQPVISAGTFTMWQEGEKQLFFAANDSGHYRPDFESLTEFKKRLTELGIDRERVICIAIEVDFDNLLATVRRKHESRKDEVVILRKLPIR